MNSFNTQSLTVNSKVYVSQNKVYSDDLNSSATYVHHLLNDKTFWVMHIISIESLIDCSVTMLLVFR